MQFNVKQNRLLKDILTSVRGLPDAPVKSTLLGDHLAAVTADKIGICTRAVSHEQQNKEKPYDFDGTASEMASLLINLPPEAPNAVAYGFAAVNALLPIPEKAFPLKAQDLLLKYGKGKNAAVVGHFPFVEKLISEFKNLRVIEMNPRPGDFPSDKAAKILPEADVIAVTATTLLNGTCAGILGLIPEKAFTIMLGPSTPFAAPLFDWGINALAGCEITDPSAVLSGITEGLTYRKLEGVNPLIWMP